MYNKYSNSKYHIWLYLQVSRSFKLKSESIVIVVVIVDATVIV